MQRPVLYFSALLFAVWVSSVAIVGCTTEAAPAPADGGIVVDLGVRDAGPDGPSSPSNEDAAPTVSRFIEKVVSFTPGTCAGFGASSMPDIVLGPPRGEGLSRGSLDVVSLGSGGEIVLSFESNPIVDGPGVDFIVFENAFFVGGDPQTIYAEVAEISVSDDGTRWVPFPCNATASPYGQCAGWHPVTATSAETALDLATAGGDQYDLADVGLPLIRFIKITDKTTEACPPQGVNNSGFDLDAIAAVHTAADR